MFFKKQTQERSIRQREIERLCQEHEDIFREYSTIEKLPTLPQNGHCRCPDDGECILEETGKLPDFCDICLRAKPGKVVIGKHGIIIGEKGTKI